MIHQLTVDVSEPPVESITKLTPGVMEATGAEISPVVPPAVFLETNMIELASTADVDTVAVPAAKVAVPIVVLAPVVTLSFVPTVSPVVVVKEPGVVIAPGRDKVVVPADVEAVIWAAVPLMAKIVPEEEESCTQVAERIPPAVESPIN
jgi:hypothetical protein